MEAHTFSPTFTPKTTLEARGEVTAGDRSRDSVAGIRCGGGGSAPRQNRHAKDLHLVHRHLARWPALARFGQVA